MSYTKKDYQRSNLEKAFLPTFLMATIFGYITLKYPELLVSFNLINSSGDLYFFGKSPSFWYMLVYTLIVCGISLKVLFIGKNIYGKFSTGILEQMYAGAGFEVAYKPFYKNYFFSFGLQQHSLK